MVKKQEMRSGAQPYEDRALKAAAQFFGQELLPLLGVKEVIRGVAPTEQVRLEIKDFQEDFNFWMEKGYIYHLEFESDEIVLEDMRRFRCYEAVLSYNYGAEVITCVVCTGRKGKVTDRIKEGINVYRVRLLWLRDGDADQVLREAEERQAAGVLDRQSLVQLLLTPLMSGEMARKERILKSLKMIRGEQAAVDEAEKRQMESVLYALAMKFLTKEELEEVWEVFRMTVLGEILVEHGKEIGIAEGRSQGIEEGRTQGIEAFILGNLEENIPRDRIVEKLIRRFSMTPEEAECCCQRIAGQSF